MLTDYQSLISEYQHTENLLRERLEELQQTAMPSIALERRIQLLKVELDDVIWVKRELIRRMEEECLC